MTNRAVYISLMVLTLLATVWFYVCNRYTVLSFAEERQLYQTGLSYFCRCIEQPGGLIRYIGAFFTQFYCFFLPGAAILAIAGSAVYGVFIQIIRKHNNCGHLFAIPLILPILLMFASSDYRVFGLHHVFGILWNLILFGLYYRVGHSKRRFVVGVLLYFVAFFTSGGNAFILVTLILIKDFFEKKFSVIYTGAIVVLAVLIPFIARMYIYTTPLNVAYFALTPFDYHGKTNMFYNFAWFGVPAIYFVVINIACRRHYTVNIRKIKIVQWLFVCLLAGYAGFEMNRITNPAQEKIMRMAYNTERGNWDAVLADGSANGGQDWNVVPVTYFTNIALSEKGKLASEMFKYRQTGVYGMFLAWEPDYRIFLYTGEMYYRLGIMQEARHCAFEASITDYGSKAMRRLVYASMLMRDTPMFDKYIRMFDKSPTYSKWAGEQREHYRRFLADSTCLIPEAATVLKLGDFRMNYNRPAETLMNLMKTNPQNKKVFEELIACFLLEKNMDAFFETMENYYKYMDYENIPRHIEEALLICENLMKKKEYIVEKYPVRTNTRARIFTLLSEVKTMSDRELQKKYGDTYTHYYIKIKPLLLDEIYNSVY